MVPTNPGGKRDPQKEINQLFACLIGKESKVYFASMVDRDQAVATMRSSHHFTKGQTLILYPVPSQWDGAEITPQAIQDSPQSETAQVTRSSSRGEFQVRLLSARTESMIRRLRGESSDEIQAETSIAGEVATIVVRGGLSTGSAATIDGYLRATAKQTPKIILDVSKLDVSAVQGLRILVTLVRQTEKETGMDLRLLVNQDSVFSELLHEMNLESNFRLYDNREMAVASFYM